MTKRTSSGKNVGRKNYVQSDALVVFLAQKYHRNGQHSLRDVAHLLAKTGFLTRSGKPFGPAAINKMIQTHFNSMEREALAQSWERIRFEYFWSVAKKRNNKWQYYHWLREKW